MISRKKKRIKRIHDALSDKAILSTNKGIVIYTSFKFSRKNKKHSGRFTPQLHQKGKISEMIANAEEPKEEYDDWLNHRDGMRHNSDKTHFFKKWRACCLDEEEVFQINKKIKKQRAIRKAKHLKQSGMNYNNVKKY